jgi:hypothetical protein
VAVTETPNATRTWWWRGAAVTETSRDPQGRMSSRLNSCNTTTMIIFVNKKDIYKYINIKLGAISYCFSFLCHFL